MSNRSSQRRRRAASLARSSGLRRPTSDARSPASEESSSPIRLLPTLGPGFRSGASDRAAKNLEHHIREAQAILDSYAARNHVSRHRLSPHDPDEIETILADQLMMAATRLGRALMEISAWLQDTPAIRARLRKDPPRRRRPG